MNMTENRKVLKFIDESAALCQPDNIVWIDGSKEQRDALRAEACASGELIKLNEDLLPECFLAPHRRQRRRARGGQDFHLLQE